MDPAYIEILDTNKELRKELEDEIAENKLKDKKLKSLSRELEACYRILSHHDSTILAHEDEIASLKSEIKSLKQRLHKALQDLRHKDDASTAQDIHILRLEDKVDQLKKRIREITDKNLTQINSSPMALPDILRNIGTSLDRVENYIDGVDTTINPKNTLNGIRISITTIRGHMQRHVQDAINLQGQLNTAYNLLHNANGQINNFMNDMANLRNECFRRAQLLNLAYNNEANERRRWWQIAQERQTNGQRMAFRKQNRINILVQEKAVLQIVARRRKAEADLAEFNRAWVFNRYQKWKGRELNSRQIILNLQNNPLANMANLGDVHKLVDPQFASLPYYDGQEEPDSYYAKLRTINESARPLAVAGFNPGARANKMKGKMTGRFHPVPVNNPYNGNNPITNEAEFLNWLQGKYREVMVGTNQDALRALMTEKFSTMDTADTYEKRIKPYAQGLIYADVLPYLYGHMPQYTEMRLRQTAPANLDAFFTNLRTIWLETRGRDIDQQSPPNQSLSAFQPQTAEANKAHDFIIRLARDLQYSGISTDNETLEKFIYEELNRRLGAKTAYIRKSALPVRSTNATKKVIKKIVPKKSSKLARHCSVCAKAGHTKVNCPRVKRTKKVNHVYQDAEEDPEYSEEECIVEEEDESEEEEIEDDDENDDDDSPSDRNCYAVKKKWSEVEYL